MTPNRQILDLQAWPGGLYGLAYLKCPGDRPKSPQVVSRRRQDGLEMPWLASSRPQVQLKFAASWSKMVEFSWKNPSGWGRTSKLSTQPAQMRTPHIYVHVHVYIPGGKPSGGGLPPQTYLNVQTFLIYFAWVGLWDPNRCIPNFLRITISDYNTVYRILSYKKSAEASGLKACRRRHSD